MALFSLCLVAREIAAESPYLPRGGNDFGAETIEIEDDLLVGTETLPVELVEEQEIRRQIKAIDVEKEQKKEQASSDTAKKPDASERTSPEFTSALNVKDADIATMVKTFSRLTGRNFVVDSSVKGKKITIHLPTPVTRSEALKIFDSVLLLEGFTTVPIGNNVSKVIPAKDAKQTTIPLVREVGESPSDVLVTQLVRLEHVKADDLQQLLSQFVSKDGMVNSFGGTNALILIDSGANITRLMELVEELDVPAVNQDITIIPIAHADANDIGDKIKEILLDEAQESSRSRLTNTAATRRATPRTARTAARTGSSVGERALPIKVIPDERTNSLIIVADPASTAKVQALVEKLDSSVDLSGGRFFVYGLKHADSEALAEILNQLISGASDTASSTSRRTSGSSLTRTNRDNQRARADAARSTARTAAAAARRRAAARRGTQTGGRVNFEGDVSIAPDPATNSLIINASRADFLRLRDVIRELDVKRRQVFVEATILEVTLNKEEGFGVEWQVSGGGKNGGAIAQSNFGGLTNLFTNPAALSDLTLAAASSGTITLPGGIVLPSQAFLVTAMSRLSNVNVLSTPTVLTTDNEEAEIIVGENVPFVTSTSTDASNINNTFNQIERQDVGITLRITPQISTGDFVTLKIFVEISNVVTGTRNDPNGPTTTIRTTETTVEVKSNQMIVTGGLIADSVEESTRGVPYMKEIPVLGHLFMSNSEVRRRTNLLVFITPKIVADQFDVRDATIGARDHMEQVIEEQHAIPSRQEILESTHIDEVIASDPSEPVIPTMITPPSNGTPVDAAAQGAITRTQARLDALVGKEPTPPKPLGPATLPVGGTGMPTAKPSKSFSQDIAEEEVLDLSVKPRLPGAPENSRPRLAPPGAFPPATQSRGPRGNEKTYVVLKDLNGTEAPTPFPYSDQQGTVGIVVLGSPSSPAGEFFQTGERYVYGDREFVTLGKYTSPSKAGEVHTSFQNQGTWYQPAPGEQLSLGKSGWLRKE